MRQEQNRIMGVEKKKRMGVTEGVEHGVPTTRQGPEAEASSAGRVGRIIMAVQACCLAGVVRSDRTGAVDSQRGGGVTT